jgi:hypothetical protein
MPLKLGYILEVSSKVEKQKGAASIDCFMRRDKNTGLYLCL